MQLTPYLMLNGNTNEAIDFYQTVLGGELVFSQTFGEMPADPDHPLPEGAKDLVAHAMLTIGESSLMFSDNFPGQKTTQGDQISLCINSENVVKSKELYEALSQDGEVKMPLQETFFSPAYGVVTDKFGITFQIFTEGKD